MAGSFMTTPPQTCPRVQTAPLRFGISLLMNWQDPHRLGFTKKNEFIENMCQCIQAQKASVYPVLIMRQDNAGENKSLEKRLQNADWKLQVKMKYTAGDTPHLLVQGSITRVLLDSTREMPT